MSTGVSDQRMKGQGNQANGPKDHLGEGEDLESWRSNPLHQGYTAPITTTLASDPYMPNYYNPQFTAGYPFSVTEGTWSNGADPMGFLGGYANEMGHGSYGMDGIFGPSNPANFGTFSTPNAAAAAAGFNYFHGSGDFSWGGNASMQRKAQYEDYYREGVYSAPDGSMKTLELGMQGMGLDHKHEKDLKDHKEPKKMTWASVASQPAKPQPLLPSSGMKKKAGMPPPPMVPGKHLDIGMWEGRNGGGVPKAAPPPWAAAMPPPVPMPAPVAPAVPAPPYIMPQPPPVVPSMNHPVLDELRVKNNYNPPDFDMSCKEARFFVIKSYSEDDIHRSIKYEIWCSTDRGNKRLDQAFRETDPDPIYLFFSVNGSGHFCGMAQMMTPVDYHASSSVWSQDKWKGQFGVRWIYVKDVPNGHLRHITLENNEDKPVTNSRDTQEVPYDKGRQVLRLIHSYRHTTSIFDDFFHYEKRQEEEDHRRVPPEPEHRQERNEGRRDNRDNRDQPQRDGRDNRDLRDNREPQRDNRDQHRENRDHQRDNQQRGDSRGDNREHQQRSGDSRGENRDHMRSEGRGDRDHAPSHNHRGRGSRNHRN